MKELKSNLNEMKKDVVYWKKVIHMKANDPIGVFDSGLGGLSVVATLRQMLPYENIVYFGDSARNPCLLYTSPSPRDRTRSRMPSSA